MINKKILLFFIISLILVFINANIVVSQEVGSQKVAPQKIESIPQKIEPVQQKIETESIPQKIPPTIKERVSSIRAVDDSLLMEIEKLAKNLTEANLKAEKTGNFEEVKELETKISQLQKEIKGKKAEYQKQIETPTTEVTPSTNISQEAFFNACLQEKGMKEKLNYYEKIMGLSIEKLKEMGYSSREEVAKIITEIKKEIENVHQACLAPGQLIKEMPKPIAPSAPAEISAYYKEKMATAMVKEINADEKIEELKALREEIDRMIKELIRSQEKINYEELKHLAPKITVEAGKIQAGEIKIETEKTKTLETKIKEKKVNIVVEKEKVILDDGGVKAETILPVKIEEGKISLKEKEIRNTPQEVLKKIVATPSAAISLKEEKDKAVYQVTDSKSKKLFGIFPVKVKIETTVNAQTEVPTVLREKKPWWSFLTF